MNRWFFVLSFLFFSFTPSDGKLKTLYNHIDHASFSKHLAFYELYSDSPLGEKAGKEALGLICESPPDVFDPRLMQGLLAAFNKPAGEALDLSKSAKIASFSSLLLPLPHRLLKGHAAWEEEELLCLTPEEIDLARAIFIIQCEKNKTAILAYESVLDLIALQILAKVGKDASPEAKIRAINHLLFDEWGFRFPPHSLSSKQIDKYSFLPSVLDSRRGVCLGVSTLYLCLSQRLNLPLEMITPPGHIYVRYKSNSKIINIETTARGVHIDSKEYLSFNAKELQKRNMKEVIGMAHYNQASVFWQKSDYQNALISYEQAEKYMPNDQTLKELKAYLLLLNGRKDEGNQILKTLSTGDLESLIAGGRLIEDYFSGHADENGVDIIFKQPEEDRSSLLQKKESLLATLKTFPRFRMAVAELAMIWLKLHRHKEAIEAIESYLALDFTTPEMHYYASMLYSSRENGPKAWKHLKEAEKLLNEKNQSLPALKDLRRELLENYPEM